MARDLASLDARLAELQALPPDPREGIYAVSAEAAETARMIGRLMLALGKAPHCYPGPDCDVPTDATRGGCTVEVDEVDVCVASDGRVVSVVTLMEGDE